jgi:hypothetical protein
MAKLTRARLKELLHYDPDTGVFTWKANLGKARVGAAAGRLDKATGYILIGIDRHQYYAHRLAWLSVNGEFPNGMLDHRDTCGSNNAIGNLRVADGTQNGANKATMRTNKSGLKGVSWHSGGQKWQASIKQGGRSVGLGLFDNVHDAHDAYKKAASERFGEFARAS